MIKSNSKFRIIALIVFGISVLGVGYWLSERYVRNGMVEIPLREFVSRRVVVNLGPRLKFIKADPAHAESSASDDSGWSEIAAPHTFNDVDTYDDKSVPDHRGEQNQWSGRTWYRKTFVLPESLKHKKFFIEFEGVRQLAEVYLNGQKLGVSKTGFIPFGFDLTPHLRFAGQSNVLAVMCDNRFMKDLDLIQAARYSGAMSQPGADRKKIDAQLEALIHPPIPEELDELRADQIPWNNPHWHPAHGGIYRDVKLHVTDRLHIGLPLYSFLQTEGPYCLYDRYFGRTGSSDS